MSGQIHIGSYQGPIVDGDPQANLAVVLRVYAAAVRQSLHFVCFPEVYLTGYSPAAVNNAALAPDGPEVQRLLAATRGQPTVLLVGSAIRRADGIYNAQLVIHDGRLRGIAHKTLLTRGYDDRLFKTDLALPVFVAHGIRFGVAICHSTSFVEPALYLRWRGARLLFTPHFNDIAPYTETPDGFSMSFWGHRQMVLNNQAALATLLKMVVVRSNVVIVRPDALGAGDSNIWNMDGALVAAGEPFTEQLVTASFDRAIFTREHWIDRREVPVQLLEMIADAARQYNQLEAA